MALINEQLELELNDRAPSNVWNVQKTNASLSAWFPDWIAHLPWTILKQNTIRRVYTASYTVLLSVFWLYWVGSDSNVHSNLPGLKFHVLSLKCIRCSITYSTLSIYSANYFCKQSSMKSYEKNNNEATWRSCESTCLCLGALYDLDQSDLWSKSNGSRDMNFYLVNFYLMNYFSSHRRTDRQTDRRTDRKRCIRAHRAWAHGLKNGIQIHFFPILMKYRESIYFFSWMAKMAKVHGH